MKNSIEFYDSHTHRDENQSGGFLIAIEHEVNNGFRYLTNAEVLRSKKFIPVQYISSKFTATKTRAVKYHPKFEKYSPSEVMEDLRTRQPRLAIIDSLNEPDWLPPDYWKIAQNFPDIRFLFAHAGGMSIFEFRKILLFNRNVLVDFSLTQSYFGAFDSEPRHRVSFVIETIFEMLAAEEINSRILFGSDAPDFDSRRLIESYIEKKIPTKIYRENFLRLSQEITA